MSLKMTTLVLVLALPLLAGAQDVQKPGGHRRGPPPSSLQLLLEHADTLALTAEQQARLGELQAALEQKSAPLHEQLKALRPPRPPPDGTGAGRMAGPPPDDAAMRERMQQVEPLFRELKANDEAAYAEAEALLSDAQKTQARELLAQVREAHHRRHPGMQRPR